MVANIDQLSKTVGGHYKDLHMQTLPSMLSLVFHDFFSDWGNCHLYIKQELVDKQTLS